MGSSVRICGTSKSRYSHSLVYKVGLHVDLQGHNNYHAAGHLPCTKTPANFFDRTHAATNCVRLGCNAIQQVILLRQCLTSAPPYRSWGGFKRHTTRMMPIGVPRVPYRTPKEGGWQWVDIWNCLVRLAYFLRSCKASFRTPSMPGKLQGRTRTLPW